MKFRVLKISLVLLLAFLLMSIHQNRVTAEDVVIENSSGFLGIYVGGAKVGYSSWSLEKKTVSKKEYYRLVLDETRTIKGKVTTYSYNGTIKKDLTVRSIDCEIKKGSRVTKIKGRESGGSVSLTTSTGSSKVPAQKVKTKKDTTWNYCAPLVWAWRNLPSDKPATYSRLLSRGGSVLSCELTPGKKTIKFNKEKVECVEWVDEGRRVLIQTDANGKLYNYVTTTKRGTKTEYIAESEQVAKSPGRFADFKGKDGEGDDKENATGEVEGDDEGYFDVRLTPVKDKADESSEGEYLKVEGVFSIKAIEGWECFNGITSDEEKDRWRIVCEDNKNHQIIIQRMDHGDERERIDPKSEGAKKEAASRSFVVLFMYVMIRRGGVNSFQHPSCTGIFKFPDDTYLFGLRSSGSNLASGVSFRLEGVVAQNDESAIYAIAMIPEDDWEDTSEDTYKMLGSLRSIE